MNRRMQSQFARQVLSETRRLAKAVTLTRNHQQVAENECVSLITVVVSQIIDVDPPSDCRFPALKWR